MREKDLPIQLVNLTPPQIQFLEDEEHRFLILLAGRRGRKTKLSIAKVIDWALRHPGTYWFHAAPVYTQAKKIFWGRKNDIRKQYKLFIKPGGINKSELSIELLNGSEVHVVSLDVPDRIEGMEWDGGHITEVAKMKAGTWDSSIRPAIADSKIGKVILDGKPKDGGDYRSQCEHACGGEIPEPVPYYGAVGTNPADSDWILYSWESWDVLPESEKTSIMNSDIDERTLNQEYHARFQEGGGNLYYAFSKENIKPVERIIGRAVCIGWDFNVSPMALVLCNINDTVINQFDEVSMDNANTPKMLKHLDKLFGIEDMPYDEKRKKYIVYPDATGESRHTSATKSDIAQIRNAGYGVKVKKSNPPVKDRVSSVNSKICTYAGKRKYFVNPRCKKTIGSLRKYRRDNSGEPMKDEIESVGLGHWVDALGYMIYYEFPIRSGGVELVS